MRKTKITKLMNSCLWIALLFMSSCDKHVDTSTADFYFIENPSDISSKEGEHTVSFIFDSNWTISTNTSWITFTTPNTGTGNGIVKFNASKNDAETPRTATLTIASKSKTTTLTINQRAKSLEIAFKHPSILYTSEELLALKAIISIGASSSINSTYNNLINRSNTALNYNTTPYKGNSPSDFISAIFTPASYSRDLAMAYWLTGDRRYAEKSIALIKKWAEEAVTNQYISEAGNSMYLTRGMFPMICAYDMLINENMIDTNTKEVIINWFNTLYTEALASIELWEQNDYFNKQYYQNHLVAHTMGIMMLGFVTENEDMVQYALDSPDNPRDMYELIAGCILMQGDTPHHREGQNEPAPEKGEIYDRYRHVTGPVRGLQYAHLTQTLLTTVARMCHNNGIDLFSYTAPTGENLRFTFDYYSDFYRTMDSCIKSGFYCGETNRMTLAGDHPGVYELGLRYYPDSAPINALMNSFNRENAYMDLLGFTRFFSASVGN